MCDKDNNMCCNSTFVFVVALSALFLIWSMLIISESNHDLPLQCHHDSTRGKAMHAKRERKRIIAHPHKEITITDASTILDRMAMQDGEENILDDAVIDVNLCSRDLDCRGFACDSCPLSKRSNCERCQVECERSG